MGLLFLLSLISFAFSFSVFCRKGRSQSWVPLHCHLSFRCHPHIPLSLKNSPLPKRSFKLEYPKDKHTQFLGLLLLFLPAKHFKTMFLWLLHLPFFFGQPLVGTSTMCCFWCSIHLLCCVIMWCCVGWNFIHWIWT